MKPCFWILLAGILASGSFFCEFAYAEEEISETTDAVAVELQSIAARDGTVVPPSGLKWLQRQQEKDGGWSFPSKDPQLGREHITDDSSRTKATGFALLCFAASGNTHQTGKFQTSITKGLDFLAPRMRSKNYRGEQANLKSYSIAAFAITEFYGMTQDKELFERAQLANLFLTSKQNKDGGWSKIRGQPSDLETTYWAMSALFSAKKSYLWNDLLVAARLRKKYVGSLRLDDGTYASSPGGKSQPNATALGSALHMMLGFSKEYPVWAKGAKHLATIGPQENDCRFTYFAAPSMQRYRYCDRGELSKRWNGKLPGLTIDSQVIEGAEKGSWFNSDDAVAKTGGRFEQTCLRLLSLLEYYRYTPDSGSIDCGEEEELPID